MTRKRKPSPVVDETPLSHLEAIHHYGFEVLCYLHTSIEVRKASGDKGHEWLPRDLVHWEKKLFIRYERANEGNYDFDGWEPQNGHQCGGRYRTVSQALGWFTWLEQQKAKDVSPYKRVGDALAVATAPPKESAT